MLEIENENTFKHALVSGVNLFLGAGFSLLAQDSDGRPLPTGQGLLKELQSTFNVSYPNLSQCCDVINAQNKDGLNRYLTKRFSINTFNPTYLNLPLMNIKNIFTTNIDDLIPHIFGDERCEKYINDMRRTGTCVDKDAINYLPLHGNVDTEHDQYVFTTTQLANIYNANARAWNVLSAAIETYPILFIGYSYEDFSTIQAFTSNRSLQNAQKDRWIVLFEPNADVVTYYKSLGFKIIKSDTATFLESIPNLVKVAKPKALNHNLKYLLKQYVIPKSSYGQAQRPLEQFLQGQSPIWSDIQRGEIFKTSYFDLIVNSIFGAKHTLIIGSVASGKTTLAKQVGYNINFDGEKLYFQDLTKNQAQYVAKVIGNQKVLLIVEDFTNDLEAFEVFCRLPRAKVVGVDRSYFYEMNSYKFDQRKFDTIDVTMLREEDQRGVYDSIPNSLRLSQHLINPDKSSYEAIYEFVVKHIKGQRLSVRYSKYLNNLTKEHSDLAEFLVLCAYMHFARVPLSMETAVSYFSNDHSFQEVFDMQKQLRDELKEIDITSCATDLFSPRSLCLAETILHAAPTRLLGDVCWNVIECVHPIQIYNFNIFQKRAFDKEIMLLAFPNWQEGRDFYKKALIFDNDNPFVYQQGALYLSAKKQYAEAFAWIEQAQNRVWRTSYTIKNSHAIIMFDANYESNTNEAEIQMKESMDNLHMCHEQDLRKTFHAITYAKQAIRFYQKYNQTDDSIKYLNQAKQWLLEENKNITKTYPREVWKLIKEINDILTLIY